MSKHTSFSLDNLGGTGRRFFGCVGVLIVLVATAHGQANLVSATAGSTPLGMAPGAPAGSYALSNFEHVNPYNGQLDFHLPLLQVGGRGGAQMTVMLPIEQVWRAEHLPFDCGGNTCTYDWPTNNWWAGLKPGYGPGVLQGRAASDGCPTNTFVTDTNTRLTFTTPDGTEYELRDQLHDGQFLTIHCDTGGVNQPEASRGTVFIAADGTAATFISDSTVYDLPATVPGSSIITPTGFLMLRNGVRYRIENGLVVWLQDRNGNKLSFSYDAFGRVTTIADTLARQVLFSYDVADVAPYGLSDKITFNGISGMQRVIHISKGNLGSALRSGFTLQPAVALFPELNSSSSSLLDPTVMTSVWLPDGRRYQFAYNSYSELARVVLPSGGAIEYDYSSGVEGGPASGVMFNTEIYRRVVERRVYPEGVTLEGRSLYAKPENLVSGVITGVGYASVDYLGSSGQLQARERHYYKGSPSGSILKGPLLTYPSWSEGKEFQTDFLNADGTTVQRRESQTWQQRAGVAWWPYAPETAPPNDPRITDTMTTLVDSNQVSQQHFDYDQYNNPTAVQEYDYGAGAAGALLRCTAISYLTSGYDTVNPSIASPDPHATIHLRSLPTSRSVYAGACGGALQAQTQFEYDVYTEGLTASGAVQHDAAFSTAYTTRGNVTATKRWRNTDAALLTTRNQYDDAGPEASGCARASIRTATRRPSAMQTPGAMSPVRLSAAVPPRI